MLSFYSHFQEVKMWEEKSYFFYFLYKSPDMQILLCQCFYFVHIFRIAIYCQDHLAKLYNNLWLNLNRKYNCEIMKSFKNYSLVPAKQASSHSRPTWKWLISCFVSNFPHLHLLLVTLINLVRQHNNIESFLNKNNIESYLN
jgi:hypothetical protein